MMMIERLSKDLTETDRLQVYPHADDNASDRQLAGRGYVEAASYWPNVTKPERVWGVRINISYSGFVSRKETDDLQAAIVRCWEWIEEQG